jgi:hypothetical protein
VGIDVPIEYAYRRISRIQTPRTWSCSARRPIIVIFCLDPFLSLLMTIEDEFLMLSKQEGVRWVGEEDGGALMLSVMTWVWKAWRDEL